MTTAEGADFGDLLRPFMDRELPPCLLPDAPPPRSWTGSAGAWEELAAGARTAFELKPYLAAARAICERGYRPDEIIGGQLARGSRISAGGRVVRPPVTKASPERVVAARDLVRDLQRANIAFSAILMSDLELIAYGAWTGDSKRVDVVLREAASAVRQHEAQRQKAVAEEKTKLRLRVSKGFRSIGGREYTVGEYRVDEAEADQLRLWTSRMQEQQREHDWDAPSGFTPDSWPPFSLEVPKVD